MEQSRFQGVMKVIIPVLALSMIAYHLIGVFLSPLHPVLHANTHLTFVLLLIFLGALQVAVQKRSRLQTIVLSISLLLTAVSVVYIYLFAYELQFKGLRLNALDLAIGVILCLLLLDACRRTMGIALPLLGIPFLAYAFLGHYLPPPLYHMPLSFSWMINQLGMGVSSGIYGMLIFISANIIFLFVIFGAILEVTKAKEFFTGVGTLVGGRVRGGSAETSVVSSALVGTISGDMPANIIITGTVTIPLMKKTGFRPEFAAAVEATSSSGGMLLPPIMGAQAFMMMAITGISYWSICVAGFVPAILYFLGIACSVYLHAGRENIPRVGEGVDVRLVLRRAPLFIVPFTLITVLLAMEFPPMYAAGWAMIVALALGYMSRETRPSWSTLVAGLTRGAQMAAAIAPMVIVCDFVFMVPLEATGLGVRLTSILMTIGGGSLPLLLLLSMFASLLMGTVAPISGSYLLVALLVAPVLTQLGLSLLSVHFFVMYFSILGFITPPVAPAVMIASGIASGRFLRSTWYAMRLTAAGYLLPFMFVFSPAIMLQFSGGLSGALQGLASIIIAILAIFSLATFLFGYYFTNLSWPERGLGLISAAGLLLYLCTGGEVIMVITGCAALILLTLLQLGKRRRRLAVA